MGGTPHFSVFRGLDRFQRRAGRVFYRLRNVHRPAHGAGGVNAGAARLVRETDEVRIGKPVFEMREILALAVIEVEYGDGFDFNLVLFFGGQVDVDAGIGHLAGGEHDDIHVGRGVLIENQIVER